MNEAERREFKRFPLSQPLDGWFGDFSVRIIDLSESGIGIECEDAIPAGSRALLRFFWRDREVELLTELRWTGQHGAGLTYVEQPSVIQELLSESERELLQAQQANAMGEREQNVYFDQTLTAASSRVSSTYTTWIYENDAWISRRSLVAEQPPNGFTIHSAEPDEQIDLLKRTYETGDAETRHLTRVFAEMSVATHSKSGQ